MNTKRKVKDYKEDLKAAQENASEIKNSHNFLVELAKELF